MKIILSLMCGVFLLSGCNILQSMNVEDKAAVVKALAKSGTYLGLMTIYDNDKIEKRLEVAKVLKQDVANNVIAVLSNDSISISEETLDSLLNNIPEEMRIYLRSAIELLRIKRIDLSGQIGESPTQLVKSLFIGIIAGCDMVLGLEERYDVGKNSTEASISN